FFQLLLEPIQALVIDGVLQACVLTLYAIAMITLQGYDAFGDGNHLFGRYEADQAAQPGISAVVSMGGAHTASYGYIKPEQHAIFHDGDQAEVLCEDVDVVGGWNGDTDLELAWQISVAVDRFFFWLAGDLLAIQPYLVVG